MGKHVVVVVLNWNGWRDTVACLASLKKQNHSNMDLVVVDNASSDDSESRIRSAAPDVKLLQSGANLGFGGGCNVGIRHAISEGADFVWLLNNDATAQPKALSALLNVANNDPGIASVGSVVYEADANDRIQSWGGGRVKLWSGQCQNLLAEDAPDFISGASILLRCSAVSAVGMFDESAFFMYWEDVDLSFRFRKAGWKLAVAEDSIVWHKQSASLGKHSPLLEQYYTQSGVRFLRRYAKLPVVSTSLMLLRSTIKRLITGQFRRALAVVRGFLNA